MKIVMAGGTGQVGNVPARHFQGRDDEVTALGRRLVSAPWRLHLWDGRSLGDWSALVDGADVSGFEFRFPGWPDAAVDLCSGAVEKPAVPR